MTQYKSILELSFDILGLIDVFIIRSNPSAFRVKQILPLECTFTWSGQDFMLFSCMYVETLPNRHATSEYSKTCVKRPLKNTQNKDLYDKW